MAFNATALFFSPHNPSPVLLAMTNESESTPNNLNLAIDTARDRLDAHTYDVVQWHFHESTGCPFWLEKKREFNFDPLKEVKGFDDIQKFPLFEDEWLHSGSDSPLGPSGYGRQAGVCL